jgi:anti-sigma regulatory factor (Ser/Thr protein kinase)
MGHLYEVAFRLPRRPGSVRRARAILRTALVSWGVAQDIVDNAELILSELVTNALRVHVPWDRQIGVRIERPAVGGLLRLEVSDAGGGRPEVRAPSDDETCGRGLLLVQLLAHRWGTCPRPYDIGKTVWVELTAPGLPPTPCERETTAVTVRAGQSVRIWGSWRTVTSVRGEHYPLGGLAVVLGLDDGPSLRLPAAEPLFVREDLQG